jgi:hypothetical protein
LAFAHHINHVFPSFTPSFFSIAALPKLSVLSLSLNPLPTIQESAIMTILNGYTNAVPHHRQNRRRERPGSRTRRTISRKFNIRDECEQGILDARDSSVPLPSDQAKPSPLLRQNFDQSWQRWKARQAEEAAQAEMDKLQLDQERVLLFGGEVDDDVSLCAPMLQVVMSLFGDIDYTDP